MDVSQIGAHVKDAPDFHVPLLLWNHLPKFMQGEHPGLVPLPDFGSVQLFGWRIELQLTKYMVLELVVAVLMILLFIPLARMIAPGRAPQGRFWNAFEMVLVFLRDEVARPAIGHHEAGRFLPFIWTMFFFILFCNLLGMLPWAGSPTGSIFVTGTLALVTFFTVVGSGMTRFGAVGFWTGMVPHMDLPWVLAGFLKPMLMGIEIAGLCIRHCVLAVRLLANMFAGHLVLAVVVTFIGWTAAATNTWTASAGQLLLGYLLWAGVTLASVFSAVALSLLELFVAFLQAYVFTFLAALFIGMAVHQH
jgi:F-type H+-transporting ATPase subunit a